MISSIFYFAETEQEYLDNFNRHQVKPYTIVFCKDTKSLWKNGIRYGGSTHAEITDNVDEVIQNTVTPLINQLNEAVAEAGEAADRAEERLSEISTQMDGAIEELQNAIDAEKTRLDNKVAEINDDIDERIQSVLDDYQNLVDNFEDNVAEKIESLLDDAEWVQENMPQEEVTWDSTWDQNVDNRMQLAGYWDIDPETGEKTTKWSKLQQSVDSISTEVARVDESLSGGITAVSTQVQQTADSITSIASSVSNIDGRLSTAETSISQTPEAIVSAANAVTRNLNGNISKATSEIIQKASEIVQTVTGVTVASDGTVTMSGNNLSQKIADNGDAITNLRTDWSNANLDTKDVLEWMYSGLTTKAGESGTFNDLVSAASSGDHSAISNILSLVEKIPTYQVDPQTGEPLEDEHGNYIYATDSEGNIIYQTNPDGSYKYRAKSSLTSAVDSAISGIINDTNSDYASTQMLAALGNNFAAWNAAAAESGSSIEGIVTHDNFAGELKSVAAEDWAQTGIAAKLRVPKYDENGNPVLDEHGNPVYEEISDAIGSIQTRVSSIDGVENVTNTIDGRVGDALSTFEQQVTGQVASTTAVNKLGPALAGLVSKVTGDTSSANIVSKINNMSAGVVTTANLENAVAALVARQEPIITLTFTSVGSPPTGTLNLGPQGVRSLPSGATQDLNNPGDKRTLTGSAFNEIFANTGLYYTTIQTQGGSQDTYIPIKYVSGETGVQQSGPYYAISDGQYLSSGGMMTIKISIQDLSGAVFSKVDSKIGTATAGLAAKSYVNDKAAAILAEADEHMSQITLSADRINIDAQFVAALNAVAEFRQVIAQEVNAVEINANKIVAGVDDWATIVDEGGVRIYNSSNGHEYVKAEDDYYYRGGDDYVDKENEPNSILQDNGAGWLANRNIEWDQYGDTHIGPVDTEYGLSVKTVDGSTKIILKGDIIAEGLNLKAGQDNPTTYGTGGSRGNRNIVTRISGYEFSTGLEQLQTYNNGSTDYGDMIRQEDAPDDNDDQQSPYSCIDWGAVAVVKGGQNSTANVPMAKNNKPRNYSQYINGSKSVPGSAIVVKGYDGCGYRGYTGTHNQMVYINGIAIGPADEVPNSAIYDSSYTFNQNDTYL